jgi:uridine phosphorylase
MLPIVKEKYNSKTLTSPALFIETNPFYQKLKDLPVRQVIVFFPRVSWKVDPSFQVIKSGKKRAYYLSQKRILFLPPEGIGAPVYAALFEKFPLLFPDLKRVILVGYAGSLSSRIKVGDIIFPTGAYCDDGTSRHYWKIKDDFIEGNRNLLNDLHLEFKDAFMGKHWSTDVVYRETKAELDFFREKGVLSVDMEVAAHYALGKFFSLEVASILIITDLLKEKWEPSYFSGDKELIKKVDLQSKRIFEKLCNFKWN